MQLTIAEYKRVRANGTHFIVKPGHETAEVERVVREAEGYTVVENHEEEAAVARRTAPRR